MGHGGRIYTPETSNCYECPLPFPQRPSRYTFARTRLQWGTCMRREAGRPHPPLERQGSRSIYFRVRVIRSPSFPFGPCPQDQEVSQNTTLLCSQPVERGVGKDSSAPGFPRQQRPEHRRLCQGPLSPGTAGLAAQSPRAQGNISILLAYFLPFSVFDQVTG